MISLNLGDIVWYGKVFISKKYLVKMEFILSNILFIFELFLEKKLLIKMNNVKIEKKFI